MFEKYPIDHESIFVKICFVVFTVYPAYLGNNTAVVIHLMDGQILTIEVIYE